MMMSQSLYRTLKAEYPSAEIDVMAPAWCRPLLARMPEVNQALAMPLGHGALGLGERRRLGRALRANRYDRAYVLPNSFKSALVPFFADIPQRTGWRGEMRYGLLNDVRVLDKAAFPLMVQRYVALAYDKGRIQRADDLPQPLLWPQLQVSDEEIADTTAAFNLTGSRPSSASARKRGIRPRQTLAALSLRGAGSAADRERLSNSVVRFGERPRGRRTDPRRAAGRRARFLP